MNRRAGAGAKGKRVTTTHESSNYQQPTRQEAVKTFGTTGLSPRCISLVVFIGAVEEHHPPPSAGTPPETSTANDSTTS